MEKLYALNTFLKMAGGKMHISYPISLYSQAIETIKKVWHISVTWHH